MLSGQSSGSPAVHGNLLFWHPEKYFKIFLKNLKKGLTDRELDDIIVKYSVTSYADVAQLAEQLTCNQQVIGSSPIIGFFLLWVDSRAAKGGRL